LLPELTAALPAGVLWLDSGEAIARRVRQLLAEAPDSAPREAPLLAETALFTQEGDDLTALKPLLKNLDFKQSGILPFPRGADVAGPIEGLGLICT
jgi:glutamate racemase